MPENYMRAPIDDLVSREPINVSLNPAEGYDGMQTTVQLRWVGVTPDRPQAGMVAVVNTEFRVGPKTKPRAEIRQQIANHHREIVAELGSQLLALNREEEEKQGGES